MVHATTHSSIELDLFTYDRIRDSKAVIRPGCCVLRLLGGPHRAARRGGAGPAAAAAAVDRGRRGGQHGDRGPRDAAARRLHPGAPQLRAHAAGGRGQGVCACVHFSNCILILILEFIY